MFDPKQSFNWIKNERTTINLKKNDYKYCQYVIKIALHHDKMVKARREYQRLTLL